MQIQPTLAPLAQSGPEATGRPQEGVTVAKAETPRPVEAPFKDPAPRFPYPEQNRGQAIDIQV
jgi:hypothetical protein